MPKALLEHYPKPRIVVALKTKQYRDALRQSQIISKRLDDQWFHMQLDAMGLDNVQSRLFQPVKTSAPLMSEATAFYLRLKGDGKDKVFIRAAQRNAASVIEVLGDRPINDYASSEAAGLAKDDIVLDADASYIKLVPHPWRRLKTKGSERLVPLIGASLWAARRLQTNDSSYAFPRYCDGKICNANSASAALNKWLKPRVSGHAVVHSLRHSIRDRLRAVECPSDIIDQ